jgi:hypothetical protein
MQDPRETHFMTVKHILRYLQGTLDHVMLLHCASTSDLVIYTDANRVGCLDTRRSTSGYTVFLGDNLVSWYFKRQNIIPHLSAEAEYHAVANCVAEACLLRQLLVELHNLLSQAPLIYCDNIIAIYLCTNPV